MIAYFDCFSGVSGDMTLGALVDAGADPEALRAEVAKLGLSGYELRFDKVERQGISGTQATVDLDKGTAQPHRHLSHILEIIGSSPLTTSVKEKAGRVFRTLAEAEAKVHGTTVDHVPLPRGRGGGCHRGTWWGPWWGWIYWGSRMSMLLPCPRVVGPSKSAHGILPVPAPATAEILARVGAPLRAVDVEAELVTPTGAAILATLATFRQPDLRLKAMGYGFGTKQLPWANALRIWIGEQADGGQETTSLIEANLDDVTPETLGFAMERLFSAGALDVFFTPIQMKKNRPAVMLSVIAPLAKERDLAAAILRETTTLGVRISRTGRLMADRRQDSVETSYGPVRIKVKSFEGRESCAPEYEDCARIARDRGLPLMEVVQATLDACRNRGEA